MSDLQTIADRVEIEALRAEFTDAGMMRDYDRFASLFTEDGAWRMPHIDEELVGRAEIRAAIERLQGRWDYFVQTVHPGMTEVDGDTAVGRSFVNEFGRLRDGIGHLRRRQLVPELLRVPRPVRAHAEGWKFAERLYEIRYVDTTPLAGSPPEVAAVER